MCYRLSFSCREDAADLLTECGYAFINKLALWFHRSLWSPSTPLYYSATTVLLTLIVSINKCQTSFSCWAIALRFQTGGSGIVFFFHSLQLRCFTQPDLLPVVTHSHSATCGGVTAAPPTPAMILWFMAACSEQKQANVSNMIMDIRDQPIMVQTQTPARQSDHHFMILCNK